MRLRKTVRTELNLFENILERWWEWYTWSHREAESLGLSWLMVWVLSDNNHLHIVKRANIKSIKNEFSRRITSLCGIFVAHKVYKLGKVRLLKLGLQTLVPRRFYLYIHDKSNVLGLLDYLYCLAVSHFHDVQAFLHSWQLTA